MVYDANLHAVLLLSGQNVTYGSVAGTWAFTAGQWKNLGHASATPARIQPFVTAMGNGTPILFGGVFSGGTVPSNMTFEFDAGNWHKVPTNHLIPPGRGNGGFAYDATDHALLLFGGGTSSGGNYFNDTCELR